MPEARAKWGREGKDRIGFKSIERVVGVEVFLRSEGRVKVLIEQMWHWWCSEAERKGAGPMAVMSLMSWASSMCLYRLTGGVEHVLEVVKGQFGRGQRYRWSEGDCFGEAFLEGGIVD
eukprot:scaffold17154_cov30-Attheya_sp.AAC.1